MNYTQVPTYELTLKTVTRCREDEMDETRALELLVNAVAGALFDYPELG